jgi:hypothetical protein
VSDTTNPRAAKGDKPDVSAITPRPGTIEALAKGEAIFAGELLSASITASGYRTSSGCAQDSCHTPPRSSKVVCAAILCGVAHRRALLRISGVALH